MPLILLVYQYAGYYAGKLVFSPAYEYTYKYSNILVQRYQYADYYSGVLVCWLLLRRTSTHGN